MTDAGAPDDREIIEVRFTVEPSCDGWRLDRYLQHKTHRLSRNRIARIIRRVLTLNGDPVRKTGVRVHRGDRVLIRRPAPVEPDVPRHFAVAGEGPGWLAVSKPAGLPVHPSAHYLHNTLTALIRERFGAGSGINMAHRLDRETSGLVLFGTDPEAIRRLKAAFRLGEVHKTYLAIAHGDLEARREVDAPIGPAPKSVIRLRMGARPDGQPSRTVFTPLERFGSHTLIEARPATGRQHQIRVHLEVLGLHLVGDKIYGHPDAHFLDWIERGQQETGDDDDELARHALHAAALDFPVPDGSERRTQVKADLPDDMAALLARLRG